MTTGASGGRRTNQAPPTSPQIADLIRRVATQRVRRRGGDGPGLGAVDSLKRASGGIAGGFGRPIAGGAGLQGSDVESYIAELMRGSASGGGGFDGSGYIEQAYQAQMKAIDDSTNAALGAIGNQRQSALNELNTSFGAATSGMKANLADYQKQESGIRQQMAGDLAASQQAAAAAQQAARQALASQGGQLSQAAVETQNAETAAAAGQAQAQQALAARLSEVATQGNNATQSGAALVNQGGQTTLANNYNDIVARIQAQRAQQAGQAGAGRASALFDNARQLAATRAASSSSGMSRAEAEGAALDLEMKRMELADYANQLSGRGGSGNPLEDMGDGDAYEFFKDQARTVAAESGQPFAGQYGAGLLQRVLREAVASGAISQRKFKTLSGIGRSRNADVWK